MKTRPFRRGAPLHKTVAALCLAFTVAAGSRVETAAHPDTTTLADHVSLSVPAGDVRVEIVTLPGNKGGANAPGPTDYAAVLATATVSATDAQTIFSEPAYLGRQAIPQSFVRPWLAANDKAALESVFFRDVERLTTFASWSPDERSVRSRCPLVAGNGCSMSNT